MPTHRGRDFACAAGGQEGRNLRFPPSCGSPLSLRRATGAVDRSPAKRLPPTCCCDRQGLTATPEGRGISLLAAFEKWAAILWRNALLRASARPYLRQQMPQIFGQTPNYLLPLRRKRGDSQEGRKLGFSPLVRPRRAGALSPPPAGGEPPLRVLRTNIKTYACLGKNSENVLPLPGCELTLIYPPFAAAISRARYSPSPTPCSSRTAGER